MQMLVQLTAGLMISTLSLSFAIAQDKPKPTKVTKVQIGPASYQIPTNWKREQPANRFRAAQFSLPLAKGDQGKAQFLVYYFGGQGGSVEDNLNRWIGMFQDKTAKEKIEKFEVAGMKVTTLDISGTFRDRPAPFVPKVTLRKNYRMMAAVAQTRTKGPYFFRMVGPAKSIAAELEHWKQLWKTVEQD